MAKFDPIKVTLLSTSAWLSLSQEARAKLAEKFNLKKSGTPQTTIGAYGGKVESDGYTPQDLANITVARMQEILDVDSTDFYDLFRQIVGVIENPPVLSEESFDTAKQQMNDFSKPKKRGRPSKKNEKTNEQK